MGSQKQLLIITELEETIEDKVDNEIDKSELELCKDKIRDVIEDVKNVKHEVEGIKKTRIDTKNKKSSRSLKSQPSLDMTKAESHKRARLVSETFPKKH
jgi:hypothetical protein